MNGYVVNVKIKIDLNTMIFDALIKTTYIGYGYMIGFFFGIIIALEGFKPIRESTFLYNAFFIMGFIGTVSTLALMHNDKKIEKIKNGR